jgi:hypothetical protein
MKICFTMETGKAEITSNIKEELRADFLADFIRGQLGAGKDTSPVNEKDEYQINIGLDLSGDVFYCDHDCGNKGLREGILMQVLKEAF